MTTARDTRRERNEAAILRELRLAGALGRAELARRAGLPRSSVFAIVGDLLERGVLVEREAAPDARRGRGRPGVLVSLDPAAGLLIGVDLGRGRARMVVANVSHQVVATGAADLPRADDPAEYAAAVEELIRGVCREQELDLSGLDTIALGVVGIPGLHTMSEHVADLSAALSDVFGVRVVHGNNTKFAALAEATWGAGRNAADLVYVRWSVGVGGGFVIGGRVLSGANGAAAELGHVSIDPGGARCECGGRGCLELAIGGPALLERCGARGLDLPDLDALIDAARSRVAVACGVIEEAAAELGRVLAGTVVQLDPERVIIGGELGQLGSLVLDIVRAEIARLALPDLPRRLQVVQADLGVNDAALGAVVFAMRTVAGGSTDHLAEAATR